MGSVARTYTRGRVSVQPSAPPQGEVANHSETPLPSGRLLLRMSPALHRELANAAEREGSSLNGFIIARLADSVDVESTDVVDTPSPVSPSTSTLTWLLTANVVAVTLAALAALAIVLVVWLS